MPSMRSAISETTFSGSSIPISLSIPLILFSMGSWSATCLPHDIRAFLLRQKALPFRSSCLLSLWELYRPSCGPLPLLSHLSPTTEAQQCQQMIPALILEYLTSSFSITASDSPRFLKGVHSVLTRHYSSPPLPASYSGSSSSSSSTSLH